jgi:hypothetical protein
VEALSRQNVRLTLRILFGDRACVKTDRPLHSIWMINVSRSSLSLALPWRRRC